MNKMTPDVQARALVRKILSIYPLGIITDGEPKERLICAIAAAIRANYSTWTDKVPTTIGEYHWRRSPADDRHVVTVFPGSYISKEHEGLWCAYYRQYRQGTPVDQWTGQWSRIELPEEP